MNNQNILSLQVQHRYNETTVFLNPTIPLPAVQCLNDCSSHCMQRGNLITEPVPLRTVPTVEEYNQKVNNEIREISFIHFVLILCITAVILLSFLALFMYYLFQVFKHGFHL